MSSLINRIRLYFTGYQFAWLTYDELRNNHAWWEVYQDSFPKSERDTQEEILSAVATKLALAGGFYLGKNLIGIAVIYLIDKPKFTLLHYFAIHKPWRQKKIGTHLFTSLLKAIKKMDHPCLILEAEDPAYAENTQEFMLQSKRLNFYYRLGVKDFDIKYFQPGLHGMKPVPMKLMHHSLTKDISAQEIAQAIYLEKYAKVNKIPHSILLKLLPAA